MPKGPNGQRRPGDVEDNATPADKAHHSGGQQEGEARARAASMTPERRAEIAKKAAAKRREGSN